MGRLKSALTSRAGDACLSTFVRMLEWQGEGGGNLLRALTYHRIADPSTDCPLHSSLISATPGEFARQMDLIADRRVAVSLEEVLDCLNSKRPLRPGAVLLTFDDAYRCFAEKAWPVMRDRGLPVVLFVATAFPDSERRFWWDRLHSSVNRTQARLWTDAQGRRWPLANARERKQSLRGLGRIVKSLDHDSAMRLVDAATKELGEVDFENPVLSWCELEDLARDGVTMAPHTRTHPLLDRVSLTTSRAEASDSRRDLLDRLGSAAPVIAYPAGAHNKQVSAAMRDEGFEAAFTVRRGINDLSRCDPFQLRRINVGLGTTVALLRAQLLPQTRFLPAWDGA